MTKAAAPPAVSPLLEAIRRRTLTLAVASVGISVLLSGGLYAVHLAFHSQLALAQAADSLSDVFTGVALAFAMRVAAAPPDEEHPAGHQRAEPLGALFAAFMAGMLAIEVLRGAVGAIVGEEEAILTWPLAAVFGLKVVAKSVIAWSARERAGESENPVLRALHLDARNDVAVGTLAVLGFFAARYGWGALDAWLAVPVAAWVGVSGMRLAAENVRLLMGASVDEADRIALEEAARDVPGVREVHRLRAVFHGTAIDVSLHVAVDPELSLRAARDIAHAVEARLLEAPGVCHVVAHLDLAPEEQSGGAP